MTLLERFDAAQVEKHIDVYDFRYVGTPEVSSIRRALAIAQAVEEYAAEGSYWTVQQALRRADELLRSEK